MATQPSFRWSNAGSTMSGTVFDEGLLLHMLRGYNYMGLGLVITGLVAWFVGTTPALYVPIFSWPLQWVIMLAPLAFVLFFSFKIDTIPAGAAQGLFQMLLSLTGQQQE